MAPAPEMDVTVRITMSAFVVLLAVAIGVYHWWLARFAARREREQADVASRPRTRGVPTTGRQA